MKTDIRQDWGILAISGWLFFSPFFLGYATLDHPAAWVAFVCALLLYVSAAEALVVPDTIEDWLDGGVGLAMIASPFVLGFVTDFVPTVNTFLSGLAVTVLATSALIRDREMAVRGHHWAPGTHYLPR